MNLESDPLLSDLIANNDDEIPTVTFGTGFTGITDIETGPDGNLYVLTFDREADGLGSLYRLLPASGAEVDTTTSTGKTPSAAPPPPTIATPSATDGGDESDDTVEQNLPEQEDEDEDNDENQNENNNDE